MSPCPFPTTITITPRAPPKTLNDSNLIIMFSLESFSHQCYLMVSRWILSDKKPPQVSRTLLSILVDLNSAVVWISTRPLISTSYSPCTNPLLTVPRAPITTGITVTFTFCSFFNSQARSRYVSFFSLSFNFSLWSTGTASSTIINPQFILLYTLFQF